MNLTMLYLSLNLCQPAETSIFQMLSKVALTTRIILFNQAVPHVLCVAVNGSILRQRLPAHSLTHSLVCCCLTAFTISDRQHPTNQVLHASSYLYTRLANAYINDKRIARIKKILLSSVIYVKRRQAMTSVHADMMNILLGTRFECTGSNIMWGNSIGGAASKRSLYL